MDIYDLLQILARAITLMLVLPLHEAAHAWIAYKLGDDTAARQGRLTLNPFAHLDILGSILILFTGFGWAKPVPINPIRMKKYRAGIALTALAGPMSNIAAALFSALIYSILMATKLGYDAIYTSTITPMTCILMLLKFLVSVNVGLAIFNLIPVPPLDGFNVLRYFTKESFDRWFFVHQREVSICFLIVILVLNRVPAQFNPMYYANRFVTEGIWRLVSLIPQYHG